MVPLVRHTISCRNPSSKGHRTYTDNYLSSSHLARIRLRKAGTITSVCTFTEQVLAVYDYYSCEFSIRRQIKTLTFFRFRRCCTHRTEELLDAVKICGETRCSVPGTEDHTEQPGSFLLPTKSLQQHELL